MWEWYEALWKGHIEQAGNRITVTTGELVHKIFSDGTLEKSADHITGSAVGTSASEGNLAHRAATKAAGYAWVVLEFGRLEPAIDDRTPRDPAVH